MYHIFRCRRQIRYHLYIRWQMRPRFRITQQISLTSAYRANLQIPHSIADGKGIVEVYVQLGRGTIEQSQFWFTAIALYFVARNAALRMVRAIIYSRNQNIFQSQGLPQPIVQPLYIGFRIITTRDA